MSLKIRATCALPGFPGIPLGDYGDPEKTGLRLRRRPLTNSVGILEEVEASQFALVEDFLTEEESERRRQKLANRLLSSVNRLIRWYRFVAVSPSTLEYSLGSIGTIVFHYETGGVYEGWGQLTVVPEEIQSTLSLPAIDASVRSGFEAEMEPPVADLLLLDARQALNEARFRQAVLSSWSAIESTFNPFFRELAARELDGDWSDGVKFIQGKDFGIKHKMSVGLSLLGCRSLFAEPEDFWNRLSVSYTQRNKIIHEGQTATEDDARFAVRVAGELVIKVRRLAEEQDIVMAS